MSNLRKHLGWALPALVLAVGLALAVVAVPALRAQQGAQQQPMPMQGRHMHHGMMGSEQGQMSDQMKARHDQMMQEMQEHMARMDDLMAKMDQATGQDKVDAMAAVLDEMWSQHKEMMGHMGGGAMAGMGMGCHCPMMEGQGDDNPPPKE